MEYAVREAVPTDAVAIRDVHIASIKGLGTQAYDEEQVAAWAHPRDPEKYPIQSEITYVLVAETDERIVGFGWMKPDAADYFKSTVQGEITATYVHPSVAREGVGSAIYSELEKHARRQSVASLGLWASLPAVPFYRAHGYSKVAEHTHEFHDGIEGTVIEMRKDLDK